MKKLLFILGLVLSYLLLNGQVVMEPFYYQSSKKKQQTQQNSNNENVTIIRTTAYCVNTYNGQIYKTPIKVKQERNGYYTVTERYVTTGYGGDWQKIYPQAQVSKCISNFYDKNSLENQFMYKALIYPDWYYFDL
jgi:hypothetical protein